MLPNDAEALHRLCVRLNMYLTIIIIVILYHWLQYVVMYSDGSMVKLRQIMLSGY